jgi:hypothetical protein
VLVAGPPRHRIGRRSQHFTGITGMRQFAATSPGKGAHSRAFNAVPGKLGSWRDNPMLMSEKVARTKWCPMVRIEGANRHYNTMTDGFANSENTYHCIASDCMAWRQFHISFVKGGSGAGDEGIKAHGYCGYAGKPDID